MKRILLSSGIVALVLSACSAKDTTIRIGYIGPLTGDAASYGSDTLNGVRIAADEINARGGINGKKIELIAEDGRCNASDASLAAQKLINIDKVVAIIGGQCSSETLAIAPIAEAARIPLVSPVSSSADITKSGEYVFRVYPSDAFKGKVIATLFADQNLTRIAILSENTDFCQGIRTTVVANLADEASAIFDEVVDPGTKDFRTLLTRLKDMEFHALLINGQSDAVNAEIAKQARELGITQAFFGTDTADSVTLGTLAGSAVEGMQFINTSNKLGEGGPQSFASQFRLRYDEPKANMSFATLAHDALGVVAQAIGEAGTDGTAIKDYLLNLQAYEGAAGSLHFDENGDVMGIGYAVKTFKNGAVEELKLVSAE
jgi:branched-chain amino acid transport system substrate-binding protein